MWWLINFFDHLYYREFSVPVKVMACWAEMLFYWKKFLMIQRFNSVSIVFIAKMNIFLMILYIVWSNEPILIYTHLNKNKHYLSFVGCFLQFYVIPFFFIFERSFGKTIIFFALFPKSYGTTSAFILFHFLKYR